MYYVIKETGPDGTGAFGVGEYVDGKVLVKNVYLSEAEAENRAKELNKLAELPSSDTEEEGTEEEAAE